MTHEHDHKHHGHGHDHHGHKSHQHGKSKGLHKDWRAWVAVGLMLAAMLAYIFTMDEALAPGEAAGERMPAEAGP